MDNPLAHQGTDNSLEQAEEPFPQEALEDSSQLLELAEATKNSGYQPQQRGWREKSWIEAQMKQPRD